MDWDGDGEQGRWYRLSSDLLLLATSMGSTLIWITSWVAGGLCLALRSSGEGRDEDGYDF
jgi:hypothetical protein